MTGARRNQKRYARSVTISVPVPLKLKDTLEKLVEEGYFATVSEAVRWALVYVYVKHQLHRRRRKKQQ